MPRRHRRLSGIAASARLGIDASIHGDFTSAVRLGGGDDVQGTPTRHVDDDAQLQGALRQGKGEEGLMIPRIRRFDGLAGRPEDVKAPVVGILTLIFLLWGGDEPRSSTA